MEGEIHIKFHYDKGSVTASTRNFVKPAISEMGDNLTFNPELTSGYVSEIGGKPPSGLYLFNLLEQQLQDEEDSTYKVRDMEDQVRFETNRRRREKNRRKLPDSRIHPFEGFGEGQPEIDRLLIRPGTQSKLHAGNEREGEFFEILERGRLFFLRQEREEQEHREREVEEEIDYLAPFLARLGIPQDIKTLSSSQAKRVRNEFLETFKQMLVNRANDIQRTFEKVIDLLAAFIYVKFQ